MRITYKCLFIVYSYFDGAELNLFPHVGFCVVMLLCLVCFVYFYLITAADVSQFQKQEFAGFVSATAGRKYSPSPAAENNSRGGLSPAGFSVYQVYNL